MINKLNYIFVTGGAGYIGSHVCKLLKKSGYIPVTYDNLIHGHKDFVKWGPFIEGDILDKNKVEAVFKKYKPEVVMHFAGFGYVGESFQDSLKYYKNNVAGSISLLEAMKTCSINKIIFSSSCATFGIPDKIPISESELRNPVNPYGRSKLMIEKILYDFEQSFGCKNIILRYFNAAGADPECEIGEDHDPELHLIPLILDVALGKNKKITIFGNDYDTPDGTCVRDYIHVNDLAKAHVLALEYLKSYEKSDFFNLGIGKGFSVKEIIKSVEKITGKNIKIVNEFRRQGDPPTLISNSKKAIEKLNWNIEFNDIDEIIEHAWNWHKKRFG